MSDVGKPYNPDELERIAGPRYPGMPADLVRELEAGHAAFEKELERVRSRASDRCVHPLCIRETEHQGAHHNGFGVF
jgi:hypothetical protein